MAQNTIMVDLSSIYYIILALFMALASGVLGSFAIMRRMGLASDPMSHIALPGLAVAAMVNINPLLGAGVALILGAFLVWGLEKQTGISTEVMIGVVFSLALAVGSFMVEEEHELVEALLGEYSGIGLYEALLGVIVSIFIIIFLLREKNKLMLTMLSPEIAKTSGLNISRINLYFLLIFAATLLLGLRYLGILLMGSLIIIPAAVGRQLAGSFKSMLSIGAGVSVLSVLTGLFISEQFSLLPGPSIIVVASLIFLASLLFKRNVE